MKKPSVCFFAKVESPDVLERVEFYANDLRMLRALGFKVRVATKLSEIRPADFYFVWWWTWAWWPVLCATLLRRPVIVTGTFDLWKHRERPWWHRRIIEWPLAAADANVFVSELELREIPQVLRVRNPQISPCGIDIDKYRPGGPRDPATILTIATMRVGNAERKGIPDLLNAAPLIRAKYPDVQFVLAGAFDPLYPARVHELGIEDYVKFPGIISDAEKVTLMQRCAVYLQPSRHEGFGLATAEAMSCGAAVVTTPAGAVPEVGGDAVCYAKIGSAASVAEVVGGVLDDPSAAAILGAKARARIVEHFALAHHTARWRTIVCAVVTGAFPKEPRFFPPLQRLYRRLIGTRYLRDM